MNLGLNFSLRMYVSWITCKTVVYTIAKVSFTLVTTLLFSLSQHCCNIRYFKYESQAMQIVVAFHRYLGSDFYIQSGFSQIGSRQTWQYLGGIIGIHQCYYIHIVLECIVVCMEACSAVCGNVVQAIWQTILAI